MYETFKNTFAKSIKKEKVILPKIEEWKEFIYSELFKIGNAKGPKKQEAMSTPGNTRYLSSGKFNNGFVCYTDCLVNHKAGVITVAKHADPIVAFYQEEEFSATNTLAVWEPLFNLNKYNFIFLKYLIELNNSSYGYGNQWGLTKMKESKISLPVDSNGNPDWQLMEDYIKSLPYSKYL